MSDRAKRRQDEKKVQKRRSKLRINEHLQAPENCTNATRALGRLKHGHGACGCSMCKPWNHDLDQEYKPSERKKLQEDEPS